MKYKFKEGDLVVIPEEDNKFGWIDMIDPDDDMYTYKVRFSNEDLHYKWYGEDELEFDHKNNYKFKVGDVCVVTDTANCGYSKETVVEIIEIIGSDQHPATYPYKIRMHGASNSTYDLVDDSSLELLELPSEPSVGTIGTQVSPQVNKAVVEPSRCLHEPYSPTKGLEGLPFNEVKSEGIKFDSDKLQWWYLWQFLPELEQVAFVLQYGDKKYPAEDGSNWKRLDNLERRASSAAMRHLSAYLQDDKLDNETTKSHLAHAITNLLFLMYNDRNQTKGQTK